MVEIWDELVKSGFPRHHIIKEAERHLRNLNSLEEIVCSKSVEDIEKARQIVAEWIVHQKLLEI